MMIVVKFSAHPDLGLSRASNLFNAFPLNDHLLARSLFSQSLIPLARLPVEPAFFLSRNLMNYRPFSPYSPLADLCSLMMLRHRACSFPSFEDPFSVFSRPGFIRRFESEPVRPQTEDQEARLRREYGIPEGEDLFGGYVEATNQQRHQQAIRTNGDGGDYFKSIVEEHIKSSPGFKEKMADSDPEVFIEMPRLAVKKAVLSSSPLTKDSMPRFMQGKVQQLEELRQKLKRLGAKELNELNGQELKQLEELRKRQKGLNDKELKQLDLLTQRHDIWKQCCNIATHLSRETDCIASMQKALESFSN